MLKLEMLENNPDLDQLLDPKKKIFNLIKEVDGSMQKFHKTVKTSKEIEKLAQEFFTVKAQVKELKTKSRAVSIDNLRNKLTSLKNTKANDIDFI